MTGYPLRRNGCARNGHDPVRKRLGELLVEAGVLDGRQLEQALAYQRRWGGKLGQVAVGLELATEQQVISALAARLACPTVNLAALEPGPELEAALQVVPGHVALRHKILPFRLDPTFLAVAMADPSNVVVIDELAFRAGRRVRIAIAGEHEIVQSVRRLYFLEPVDLAAPGPTPLEIRIPQRELQYQAKPAPLGEVELEASPRQAAVVEALGRAGQGEGLEAFESSRLAAAVARLLLLKGIISDLDLIAELAPRR